MHITGSRDGPPVKVGVAITDLTTGLYTSNSILAALLGRIKSKKGQHIDVALSDCQVASLANIASSALISGEKDSGRWGTAHRKSTWWSLFYSTNLEQHPLSHTESSKQPMATSSSVAETTDSTASYVRNSESRNGSKTRDSSPTPFASRTGTRSSR
jgi:crotonobetainyl-CoA:carnitine CoA-transferase CaiB-like acyl-CoA transferase